MLKLHDLVYAHQRVKPYIVNTPLVRSAALSERSGAEVWFKLEFCQPTGSFKIRGALNKLMSLGDAAQARGVVTASAGNHGLGTAYAAQQLGLPKVTVFVPETTPTPKVEKLRQFRLDLRQVGSTYAAAHAAADAFASETEASSIPAYDDVHIIAGAGTCGLEVITELPRVDSIMVPVGGGGLIAGVGVAIKGLNSACEIIGVQPAASPAAKLSFEQNLPVETLNPEPTIADGLAGGFGKLPFYIARTLIDDILLVSEAELRRAVYTLVDTAQMIVEASGAIAIAPLLQEDTSRWRGKTVVCLLTGANIETTLLAEILNHA